MKAFAFTAYAIGRHNTLIESGTVLYCASHGKLAVTDGSADADGQALGRSETDGYVSADAGLGQRICR
jgi:hypothetical protein